jgi:CRP-like cAMP-binding protein
LTQDVLADALGLSVVHLSRTVQQLRRGGLLKLGHRMITLLQMNQLQGLAGWTPSPRFHAW